MKKTPLLTPPGRLVNVFSVQISHLPPVAQALREQLGMLAAAFGALAGASLFFGLPNDVAWQLGFLPLGLGLLAAGCADFAFPGRDTLRQAAETLGWLLAMAGLFFALAGAQVERAGEGGLNWQEASRKAHWMVGTVGEINDHADNPARVTLVVKNPTFYLLPGSGSVKEARIGVYRSQIEKSARLEEKEIEDAGGKEVKQGAPAKKQAVHKPRKKKESSASGEGEKKKKAQKRKAPKKEEGATDGKQRRKATKREPAVPIPEDSSPWAEQRGGDIHIGDHVAVPVLLMAPTGPRYPGERDNRLWRYLDPGVVTGYARGSVEKTVVAAVSPTLSPAPAAASNGEGGLMNLAGTEWEGLITRVDGLRAAIAHTTAPMADGAVAALLVGDQRPVSPELRDAYRATGLTHLLAISGMQLTLVGGGIFLLIRRLLALSPVLALRLNTKMIAAAAGLLGAGAYTLMAGASVSVVRAFIMLCFVLLAAMAGRSRNLLRTWALAVMIILAINPAMITNAGFQLSIAAVGALLLWSLGENRPHGVAGWGRGMILSSLVAGAASAPLLVLNFGQISPLSLPANLVAVPIMALATYTGMGALASWGSGLEPLWLEATRVLVEAINHWALWLADWQGQIDVSHGWWPLVGGVSALTMAGVMARRHSLTFGGVVLMAALGLGLPRLQGDVQAAVLDGGAIGVTRIGQDYRLAWAENRNDADFLLKNLRLGQVREDLAASSMDENMMPISHLERFAWAVKRGGDWQVEPLHCSRVWQRIDEACMMTGVTPEEENTDGNVDRGAIHSGRVGQDRQGTP